MHPDGPPGALDFIRFQQMALRLQHTRAIRGRLDELSRYRSWAVPYAPLTQRLCRVEQWNWQPTRVLSRLSPPHVAGGALAFSAFTSDYGK
jgi:hypothetical protein